MMKIPVEQMFYVKMIDFGFVWSLYLISLDLQQMEEIKNIYIFQEVNASQAYSVLCIQNKYNTYVCVGHTYITNHTDSHTRTYKSHNRMYMLNNDGPINHCSLYKKYIKIYIYLYLKII